MLSIWSDITIHPRRVIGHVLYVTYFGSTRWDKNNWSIRKRARSLNPLACLIMSHLWHHGHILPKPVETQFPFQLSPPWSINRLLLQWEKSGCTHFNNYLCLWNQLEPVLAYSLCQGEGVYYLPLGLLIHHFAWAASSAERTLLGLEHMWFGRAQCEHVSASNQCWVPGLHTCCNHSLIIIMSLVGLPQRSLSCDLREKSQ